MTRSSRSSVVSEREELRTKAAMHAWWTRLFRSAYGSACFATLPPACTSRAASEPSAAVLVGGDDDGAVDAIVEPHD